MFVSEPCAGRLTICLRCQYRLLLRENTIWRSSPTPKRLQSRRISQTSRRSQQPAAAHNDSFVPENPDYDTGLTNVIPKQGLASANRRILLYRRDLLGLNALGRPAEALIIRSHTATSTKSREKLSPQQTPVSASELLAQVDAESGVVGAQRVAEHLEELRSSWASELPRNRNPTAVEFHTLKEKIHDGFTRLQLAKYYGKDEAISAYDLSSSFSSDLYTRSEWCPVIGEFPGNAAQRLNKMQKFARQRQDTSDTRGVIKPQEGLNVAKEFLGVPKSAIVDMILRRRWQIQTVDDEEGPGQIDIWPRPAYLKLLLNHSEHYPTPVSDVSMA